MALTSCFVESEWRSIQNINVKTRAEKTDYGQWLSLTDLEVGEGIGKEDKRGLEL